MPIRTFILGQHGPTVLTSCVFLHSGIWTPRKAAWEYLEFHTRAEVYKFRLIVQVLMLKIIIFICAFTNHTKSPLYASYGTVYFEVWFTRCCVFWGLGTDISINWFRTTSQAHIQLLQCLWNNLEGMRKIITLIIKDWWHCHNKMKHTVVGHIHVLHLDTLRRRSTYSSYIPGFTTWGTFIKMA